MLYKVIINRKWVPKGFVGMAIYPFILLANQDSAGAEVLMNHEKIHLKQQRELLVLPFFMWYAVEFLIRWMQLGNKILAYQAISFEREAYANECDLEYFKRRRAFSFIKYL